jgi:hypothetical protein
VTLAHRGPRLLRGLSKSKDPTLLRVAAFRAGTTEPVAGARLRLRVLAGELAVEPAVAVANAQGVATGRLRFKGVTFGLVEAAVEGRPDTAIVFQARSEGVADVVELWAPGAVPAAGGAIVFTAAARDHLGEPVDRLRPVVAATAVPDLGLEGTFKRIGPGLLECRLPTRQAAEWHLQVADMVSHCVGRAVTRVTPDSPKRIEVLGAADPRRWSPRDTLDLRAAVVDRFGNALSPLRLSAKCDGKALERRPRGFEAGFRLKMSGHGEKRVTLRDESGLTRTVDVPFAAATLTDPGYVRLEQRFNTDVLLFPNKKLTSAEVSIRYDPKRAKFVRFSKALGADVKAKAKDGLLTLSVASRVPLVPEGPDGLNVGEVSWLCLAEGETRFTSWARMSPATPGWELCVLQKAAEEHCVCINVIHRAGDAAGKAAGEKFAEEADGVISSLGNMSRCCPDLDPKVHFTEILGDAWRNTVRPALGGNDDVSSVGEFNALVATGLGRRARCINIYMVAFNDPAAGAWCAGSNIALPPSAPDNYGAHEIAHALGVGDRYAPPPAGGGPIVNPGPKGHLMSAPVGEELYSDDCKKIWGKLKDYGC